MNASNRNLSRGKFIGAISATAVAAALPGGTAEAGPPPAKKDTFKLKYASHLYYSRCDDF